MAIGHIFARFALANGATRLLEHRQNAPLKIARALPVETHPGGLEICVMDASPGLLAGDSHAYNWQIEAGAQVRVTAQGATRIHPDSRRNETPITSHQTIAARVGTGARLALWPEVIIPFQSSAFDSRTEIWLEEGAHFSIFECLSAGRIARGEAFEFAQVSLRTRIFDARGPLFCAQNRFAPAELNPQNRLGFGDLTHWASLVACGPKFGPEAARTAQEVIEKCCGYGAASALSRGGVAVSLLAARAFDARTLALEIESAWNIAGCFT